MKKRVIAVVEDAAPFVYEETLSGWNRVVVDSRRYGPFDDFDEAASFAEQLANHLNTNRTNDGFVFIWPPP